LSSCCKNKNCSFVSGAYDLVRTSSGTTKGQRGNIAAKNTHQMQKKKSQKRISLLILISNVMPPKRNVLRR